MIDSIETKFGLIPNQNLCIKIGPTFQPTKLSEAQYLVRKFWKESAVEFKKNKYNYNFSFEKTK
jgi:hypothetical protein